MSSSQQFSNIFLEWTGVLMRRSTRELTRVMKKSGLSMPQLSTLFRLYFQSGCGVTDIGSYVGITSPAASQMVERLVTMELLERTEDPFDRRVKKLALTPKGRALIQETIELRHRWIAELTSAFSQDEREAIVRSLTLLTEAAKELEEPVV